MSVLDQFGNALPLASVDVTTSVNGGSPTSISMPAVNGVATFATSDLNPPNSGTLDVIVELNVGSGLAIASYEVDYASPVSETTIEKFYGANDRLASSLKTMYGTNGTVSSTATATYTYNVDGSYSIQTVTNASGSSTQTSTNYNVDGSG